MSYFVSLFFFITGTSILINKSYKARWNTNNTDLSVHYIYIIIGIILIIYSFTIIYYSIKKKNIKQKKQLEHTICPNCKQTYNYKDLKDGKCLTCKDVDTIDIEQYYKENPFNDDE